MDKYIGYQGALTILSTASKVPYINNGKKVPDSITENIELLQELINQTKPKTLGEIKEEWKTLDWRWEEDEIYITLIKPKYEIGIKIDKKLKTYKCYDLFKTPTLLHTNNIALWISLKEHQLLIKTFIMLGWL